MLLVVLLVVLLLLLLLLVVLGVVVLSGSCAGLMLSISVVVTVVGMGETVSSAPV